MAVEGSTERPLADTMRTIRLAINLSQESWGAMLGVTERSVRHWETGKRSPDRQLLLHVRELLKRPEFRRRLHQQEQIERYLIAAKVLDEPTALVESFREMHDVLVGMRVIRPLIQAA